VAGDLNSDIMLLIEGEFIVERYEEAGSLRVNQKIIRFVGLS